MPHPLETERLLLRPFTLDDYEEAYTVLEGHPDVWKFDPGFQRSFEQRAAIVRRHAETNQPDGEGCLAVTLQQSGALLGYVGLQMYILPTRPFASAEVELFYKLGQPFWGQGYALEACRELVRFAFDELHLLRIITITHGQNERSLRLLGRLGMSLQPAPEVWEGEMMGILVNPAAHAYAV